MCGKADRPLRPSAAPTHARAHARNVAITATERDPDLEKQASTPLDPPRLPSDGRKPVLGASIAQWGERRLETILGALERTPDREVDRAIINPIDILSFRGMLVYNATKNEDYTCREKLAPVSA